jgi:FkbM family methyltransferase
MPTEIRKYGPLSFHIRNERDHQIVNEVAIKTAYERPRLGVRVRKNDVWLDCGANIGVFGVWAEKMRGARVYGYEACEENTEIAERNLTINGCKSTVTTGFITSTTGGTTEVGFNEKTPARSGSDVKTGQRLVRNFNLTEEILKHKPQGLKIDIEGAELELLEQRFPLTGVNTLFLEYHFRLDKSCANARERIGWLMQHFRYCRVNKDVLTKDAWGAWIDTIMIFWN